MSCCATKASNKIFPPKCHGFYFYTLPLSWTPRSSSKCFSLPHSPRLPTTSVVYVKGINWTAHQSSFFFKGNSVMQLLVQILLFSLHWNSRVYYLTCSGMVTSHWSGELRKAEDKGFRSTQNAYWSKCLDANDVCPSICPSVLSVRLARGIIHIIMPLWAGENIPGPHWSRISSNAGILLRKLTECI